MKVEKMTSNGAGQLTLFLSGWAASPVQFNFLHSDSDVWIVYDYRDLDFPPIPDAYREVHLVAWSMGVWVASQVVPHERLRSAIAINGTPYPVHDVWGIPRAVFQGTLERLDEANFARFCRRMCGSRTLGKQFEALNDRRISELQEELSFLCREVETRIPREDFPWSRALVSRLDHIFPAENLRCYWSRAGVPIEELDAPHHPFHLWKSWEELWMR